MEKGTLLRDFGGRDRRLRYTMAAWEAAEERGVRVRLGRWAEDMGGLSMSQWYVLVWAGLLHEDPTVTVEQVSEWLGDERMMEVATVFFERFGGTASMGEADGAPSEREMEALARETGTAVE